MQLLIKIEIILYQINQHLHDFISDEILGVIKKNVSILSFQCQAVRTQKYVIDKNSTDYDIFRLYKQTRVCGQVLVSI